MIKALVRPRRLRHLASATGIAGGGGAKFGGIGAGGSGEAGGGGTVAPGGGGKRPVSGVMFSMTETFVGGKKARVEAGRMVKAHTT